MVTLDGIPLHPLLVHAPIVLLPLVAIAMVLLLVRPSLRTSLAPIVAVLAMGAAVTALGAVWSGEQLGDVLGRGDELDLHEAWGRATRWLAVLVALGATAFVLADRFRARHAHVASAAGIATAGLAIAAVAAAGVTGHAGAQLAWEGKTPVGEVAHGVDGTAVRQRDAAAPDAGTDRAGGAAADEGVPVVEAGADALPGAGSPGVDVALGEWALVPSVVEAPPGATTFRFHNLGTVTHTFRIRTAGSGRDRLEWRSERVAPGDIGLLTADLPPGDYELDCSVEDEHGEHDQLGMEARFVVRVGAEPLAALAGSTAAPAAEPDPAGGVDVPQSPADGTARMVDIQAFVFDPVELRVPVGAEVVWVNHDPAPHTATGEGFDTGHLPQGATGAVTFETPGAHVYVCSIHPSMRGTVLVEP